MQGIIACDRTDTGDLRVATVDLGVDFIVGELSPSVEGITPELLSNLSCAAALTRLLSAGFENHFLGTVAESLGTSSDLLFWQLSGR